MTKLTLILGDMLFKDISPLNLTKDSHIFMCEDYKLCTHYTYHKHKLILFLSSMRSYRDYLSNYAQVTYHQLTQESVKEETYFEELTKCISEQNITVIETYEITDRFFRQKIQRYCTERNITLTYLKTQSFYFSSDYFETIFSNKARYNMTDFYVKARKDLDILMDGDKPKGGKWHFDYDNRKKVPKNYPIPAPPQVNITQNTQDVMVLVDYLFEKHPGDTSNFQYPTTNEEAIKCFDTFLQERFTDFGPYEDAIVKEEFLLFHSNISCLLNCGLLTPKYVIQKALKSEASLQSIEGFVRQIFGWREFMRGMYELLDFSDNTLNHKRRLTQSWYDGTTGIEPLDDTIKKVTNHAYAHHIERLMIVGNCMLLCEIHPDDVYKWFMEMFIDSADWVMIPNVYAMSQFATGSKMTTKPYICGSNYIIKMSNYTKCDWADILDGLYWKFVDKNKELLLKNHRMSFMARAVDKMDPERKNHIFTQATLFVDKNTR